MITASAVVLYKALEREFVPADDRGFFFTFVVAPEGASVAYTDEYLKQIDAMYAGREWLSDKYSVLDPYAFVFYTWAAKRGQPVAELKNYGAAKDRLLKRPAVQRVVADEGVKV